MVNRISLDTGKLTSVSAGKKRFKSARSKLLSSVMSKLSGDRGDEIGEAFKARKVTEFQELMTKVVEELVDEIRK